MKNEFLIRTATLSDLPEILDLFVVTISTICTKDYTAKQIEAWILSAKNKHRWLDKINREYFLIVCIGNKIAGFGSLENDYLDMMYVHKDYQRQGVASHLLHQLEKQAAENGIVTIHSDISKTAMPFFEKNGYRVTAEQVNDMNGVIVENLRMEKILMH